MIDIDSYEFLFFEVINDLKEYLEDLVVVGGWLAFLYSRFLWRKVSIEPITTVDIDLGLRGKTNKKYLSNIYQVLSKLDYEQHHINLGKIYPVVFYKKGKIPVEFIVDSGVNNKKLENILGMQINLNKVEKFDFLLLNTILLKTRGGKPVNTYFIKCPKPSAFLYHKGATFADREDKAKQAKDLYYMYFILRNAEELDTILNEIRQYHNKGYFVNEFIGIKKYFKDRNSPGCLMIERENGPDEYITDIRTDIFNRFNQLLDAIF